MAHRCLPAPLGATLTVTTTDVAGNLATGSVSYSVVAGSVDTSVHGGETVSTSGRHAPAVPVQTAVVVPSGVSGELTVQPEDTPPGSPVPAGFGFFNHEVVLSGPAATPASPYQVTFTVDASQLNGLAPADVEVFRNWAEVTGCSGRPRRPCPTVRGLAWVCAGWRR